MMHVVWQEEWMLGGVVLQRGGGGAKEEPNSNFGFGAESRAQEKVL